MHIVIMVAIGLVLVAAIYVVTAIVMGPEGSSRRVARGGAAFVLVWVVVSAVDFGIGLNAGYSVAVESAAHAAIFGIPALAAWGLALLASRQDPARPA